MKTDNKDIGTAFKEAFDEFTIEPSADLWANIEKETVSISTANTSISILKYAASIAIIAAITAMTYFAISTGLEHLVDRNNVPEVIEEPIIVFPKQDIEQNKDIAPINAIEPKIETKESIKNTEIVKNTTPKVIEAPENNTTNKTPEIREKVIILPVAYDIEINEELIEPEQEIAQQIVSEDKEEIIEPETEIKNSLDSFKVAFGSNKLICFGEDAILEVEEGYIYKWSNGELGNKVKVSPTENSYYTVSVSNEKGQTTSHEYNVEIDRTCSALFVPSAFTPNGDGQNDFFKAEGQGLTNMRMYVYDKNGSKVFEANNIDDSWDGTYKGQQQGAGMFFYVAEYTDALGYAHIKKGQVTIIK